MRQLFDQIADANVVLDLEPEELAQYLLPIFQQAQRSSKQFHIWNMTQQFTHIDCPYPLEARPRLKQAFMNAAHWLVSQGLIAPSVEAFAPNGPSVLTPRAMKMDGVGALRAHKSAGLLRELLDKSIAEQVWQLFIRGQFSTAVLIAMRQVEIEVRNAGGYGPKMLGTALTRAAFAKDGPLADKAAPAAEREGRDNLFAGAIGSYKNPPSHREVNMDDPDEAFEVILLANHLLRIVRARIADREKPVDAPLVEEAHMEGEQAIPEA